MQPKSLIILHALRMLFHMYVFIIYLLVNSRASGSRHPWIVAA